MDQALEYLIPAVVVFIVMGSLLWIDIKLMFTAYKETGWETDLQELYGKILANGELRADRTGTGTIALFGERLVIDLRHGFPAVTTKKLAFKSMVAELLWFIEGSGDERRLAEIQFGTRDEAKRTIWSDNANAEYWKSRAKFKGDLGRIYGVQWRHWATYTSYDTLYHPPLFVVGEIDQLKELINKLKTNPTDRRLILSAWNAGELDSMALPPCHMFAQFYLSNDNELSCQMYQRSADVALGIPFNIASYALLTHMIAHVIAADVGTLTMVLGDAHLYLDHIEGVKKQLSKKLYAPPILNIIRKVGNIDDFKMSDFELLNYQHHAAVALKMSI